MNRRAEKARACSEKQLTGQWGFSVLEVLVTVAVITIVSAAAVIGMTRARASMRLAGTAREYASYIERARINSIRRHADDSTEWANVAINSNRTSYVVTMDTDGDGTLESRTIQLPEGLSFETQETIAFDWRGRTQNTVGGITTSNAQVAITLRNTSGTASVDITGSGDVTINSQVFDDSVPNINLNVPDLGASAGASSTPASTPTPGASPSPTSYPSATPTPSPGASPSPTSTPTPTPTPTPSPTPNPTPTPTPTPTPQPTPSPSPVVPCVLVASPTVLSIAANGVATVSVTHNSSGSVTVTSTSSKPSDLQITPANQLVAFGSIGTFTVKSKRSTGAYSATFSSNCGETIVSVIVQ